MIVTSLRSRLLTRQSFTFCSIVFDETKNYYKILNIGKKASKQEIKSSYYQMAKEAHPDVCGGKDQKFRTINQAYNVLSDPKIRLQYNTANLCYRLTKNIVDEENLTDEEKKTMYESMSDEDREELEQMYINKIKTLAIWIVGIGFLIGVWIRRRRQKKEEESKVGAQTQLIQGKIVQGYTGDGQKDEVQKVEGGEAPSAQMYPYAHRIVYEPYGRSLSLVQKYIQKQNYGRLFFSSSKYYGDEDNRL